MAATARILDFLRDRRPEGPCLVVDLEVIADNYRAFTRAMPDTRIFYAVKANPAPEILKLLADMGSCFDTASVPEIEMALAAGATPDRISFGNTIKKERDIARAHQLGVKLFAVDSDEEVEKVARAAPGAQVFCRILTDGAGAEWPLSRKFGCEPAMAVDVLMHAHALGLEAYGISFHVGSQQTRLEAWDSALAESKAIFDAMQARGITLKMVNLGGGFPTKYLKQVPGTGSLCQRHPRGADQALRQRDPRDDHRAGPRHGGQCGRGEGGGRADLEEARQRQPPLGLPRHRQVRRPRRDDGRGDPLPDRDGEGRRREGPLRDRRPDLRLGRRALREDALRPARDAHGG